MPPAAWKELLIDGKAGADTLPLAKVQLELGHVLPPCCNLLALAVFSIVFFFFLHFLLFVV